MAKHQEEMKETPYKNLKSIEGSQTTIQASNSSDAENPNMPKRTRTDSSS